ncbi:MAG: hypothetical protein CME24_18840 [Gemmatimonadetes bacterium]|nr:hypothetical protein [Gemmatimonadota bacterium]|tara:strand:- start:154 stop:726 length:573 start_codon:yes stop_codon:yes gene_type:complete
MPLDLQAETPVAFVCAVMARSEQDIQESCDGLSATFGYLTDRSQIYDFDVYSTYYSSEMGKGLHKCIARFGEPMLPSSLAAAKLDTLRLELRSARQVEGTQQRTVNLDPGLLSPNSLVLATTKSSGHRIAIAASLYAEVTLLFEKGAYCPLPWSYRDMQSREVQTFLMRQRQLLLDAMGGVRRVGAGEVP